MEYESLLYQSQICVVIMLYGTSMKKQVPVIQGSILNNIGENIMYYPVMHIGLLFLRNRFTDTDTEDTEIDKILQRGYTCPHYKYKK